MNEQEKLKYDIRTHKWLEQFLNDGEQVLWYGKPNMRKYIMHRYRVNRVVSAYLISIIGIMLIMNNTGSAAASEEIAVTAFAVGTVFFGALLILPIIFYVMPDISSLWTGFYCVTNQRVLILSDEHNELRHEYTQAKEDAVICHTYSNDFGDIIFETRLNAFIDDIDQDRRSIRIGFKGIHNVRGIAELSAQSLDTSVNYHNQKIAK